MTKGDFIKVCIDSKFWKEVKTSVPFNFSIPRTKDERIKFLNNLFRKIENRTYYPSPPKEYITINKGKGVIRVVPVFQLEDLIVYYYCVRKLERDLAKHHVPGTYGGFGLHGKLKRFEEESLLQVTGGVDMIDIDESPYVFTDLSEYSFAILSNSSAALAEWGEFADKLYKSSCLAPSCFSAELDISNFYDSIQIDNLEYKIRRYVSNTLSKEIYLLFHFLKFWNRHINSYRQQGAGLPQDIFGVGSRILANFYLQSYDKKMYTLCKKKGAIYFRFADDQVILTKTASDAEELVAKASSFLMREGLNLNQKKVHIRTIEELRHYFSFETFNSLSEKGGRVVPKTTLEKAIVFYFRNKDDLRKGGWSLLKRILNVSAKTKKKPRQYKKIKGHILTEEFFDKFSLRPEEYSKIYSHLNKREKERMVRLLSKYVKKSLYSQDLYAIKSFFKAEGLPVREVGMRITYIKNFYDFSRVA